VDYFPGKLTVLEKKTNFSLLFQFHRSHVRENLSFFETYKFVYRYIQTAQRNNHHHSMETELFEKPDPAKTSHYKEARYDKIEADGLPVPGELVSCDTIIIGKTGPVPTPPPDPKTRNRSIDRTHMYTNPEHTRKDESMLPRKKGAGIVQAVTLTHTRDTKRVAVTVRSHRKPQIGDKFSSRSGLFDASFITQSFLFPDTGKKERLV
jgi:DNA-directed RNA polymerase beta subunit